MSKKKGKGLQPTQIFKNVLPPNFKTWHQLLYHFLKDAGNFEAISQNPKFESLKANRELDVYQFKLDYIKARLTEEAFPVVNGLFEQIRGGKNYLQWEQLLRSFYNDYAKLATGQ